jgi:hypothetical protein
MAAGSARRSPAKLATWFDMLFRTGSRLQFDNTPLSVAPRALSRRRANPEVGRWNMANYLLYWEGQQRAVVTSFNYSDYGVDANRSMEAINLAFAAYFAGMQYVKALNLAKAGAGAKPLADLRDAASSGWGFGVHDLEDAFRHVAKSNGTWTDTNNAQYFGSFGKFSSFVPLAAANFFKAIDARIAAARALQQKQSAAKQAIEGAAGPDAKPVWVALAGHVKTVGEGLGEFEKYMWLIPATIASKSTNMAFTAADHLEVVEKVNEFAGVFLTAASETKSACESFDNAMRAGYATREAVLLTGLQRLAGFLPVLGDFYSQAIGLIPTVSEIMTTIAEHKAEMLRLARYGPAHGQQMRYLGSE